MKKLYTLLGMVFVGSFAQADPTDSIRTQNDGDRLVLCGTGKQEDTDRRLEQDPANFKLNSSKRVDQRFRTGFPERFPDSYWGIEKDSETYVCVGASRYLDSIWTFPAPRKGAFSEFGVEIRGFALDKNGKTRDVNRDGKVDGDDWTGLDYIKVFAGVNRRDSVFIANAFRRHWGLRAAPGEIHFMHYDTQGYPRRIEVTGPNGKPYVEAEIGGGNSFNCVHKWEKCHVWGKFEGSSLTVGPFDRFNVYSIEFAHNENKWVRFDEKTDRLRVYDPGLKQFLRQIHFKPEFWVMAKNSSFDFPKP
ncbi:MAG: hypothetical protein AB1540_08575 [Bdellovibrionota bacterium]